MYKGFNLDLSNSANEFVVNLTKKTYSDYRSIGNNLFKEQKNIIQTDLKQFKNMSGQLSGNQIINEWFPEIKADIFLSHSHQDEDLVICFAGWLYQEFGLTSFIDSTVWGYANDLLRMIDDEYCYSHETKTYKYSKRNYSTSHVHMMLSTSLMNMIDKCECIIFVNTPQSFIPVNDMRCGITLSPWIFNEIFMTKMLRIQTPYRVQVAMDGISKLSTESRSISESFLPMNHELDMNHLAELDIFQLKEWQKRSTPSQKERNLDILYGITSNEREIIYG